MLHLHNHNELFIAMLARTISQKIYMIANERNLEKAKAIVDSKYQFVGLNERYEESLFLLAHTFSLQGFEFSDGSKKPKPEVSTIYQEILDDYERNETEILEMMRDELDFYSYVQERYQS